MSSLLPDRRVKGGNTSYSVMCNSGISLFNHKYSHINVKYTLRCSKVQEKEREKECQFLGSPDGDVMVASSNSDVTIRDTLWNAGINRLIARKCNILRKRLLTYSVGSYKRSLRACIRIITFIMLFMAITTSILGGLINTRRCKRKSTVGTSTSLPLFESSMSNNCYSFLSVLRKFSANILGIDKKLWPCIIIETDWKDNKRLKRRGEILQKSRNTNIFRPVIAPSWFRNLRFGNVPKATFYLRSGNVAKETFWRENA